eukprot:TRINITY_DN1166_c0_g1_i1.p1 TRINITY_DN1166_c0_g1~~TRINITY_DN1166_c0_g1_i1.p1  ORF type:complete len:576 (-),score=155.38 TRINITY_DN1166_c0_g1_i1:36-1763(-)
MNLSNHVAKQTPCCAFIIPSNLAFQHMKRCLSSGLGRISVPKPVNEPFLHYAPGSVERKAVVRAIEEMRQQCPEIPCIVDGEPIYTGKVSKHVMPSMHSHSLCTFHEVDSATAKKAIKSALAAKKDWEAMDWNHRASIFLKAADLLSTKYRAKICAAMILGAGKNVWQAEIDAAVEACDFWRFSAYFAEKIYAMQPEINVTGSWNYLEQRPLEGFVTAISPFNFVAIGANLCSSPAIMGNTVVWKPSNTALLANYVVYEILVEAGLPPGVINFLPGDGKVLGKHAFTHPDFGGLHFTGSTATFNALWKQIAENLDTYKAYPRIVGETGGKNFHLVHESADVENVVNHTIRGAFEYSGQKCSATSRMYVPSTLWKRIKSGLLQQHARVKVGQPDEFDTFVSAVIDQVSFNKIKAFIDYAKQVDDCEIIAGGECDDSTGYFVEPTIIVTTNPKTKTMSEEIFGPVLTIYVYEPSEWEDVVELVDSTSKYSLTGAIFARERTVVAQAYERLRYAAGNLYVNDKCTGSMVGQQPFGGSRASGTNDKSGSAVNLMRWVSPRVVKENFVPLGDWSYPSMRS